MEQLGPLLTCKDAGSSQVEQQYEHQGEQAIREEASIHQGPVGVNENEETEGLGYAVAPIGQASKNGEGPGNRS